MTVLYSYIVILHATTSLCSSNFLLSALFLWFPLALSSDEASFSTLLLLALSDAIKMAAIFWCSFSCQASVCEHFPFCLWGKLRLISFLGTLQTILDSYNTCLQLRPVPPVLLLLGLLYFFWVLLRMLLRLVVAHSCNCNIWTFSFFLGDKVLKEVNTGWEVFS